MFISLALSSVCFAPNNKTASQLTNCQICNKGAEPKNVFILPHCKHQICRDCGKDMDAYCKNNRPSVSSNFKYLKPIFKYLVPYVFICLKPGCGLSLDRKQTKEFHQWLYNNLIPPRSK
jgi:hypothetical protein